MRALIMKLCGMAGVLALLLTGLATVARADMPPPVPEIDAGSILGGITLLTGGLAMLSHRLDRK